MLGENEDVSTLPKKYREEYLAASKETKKAAEAVDKEEDVRYSKDRLINRTFPPYDESGSEANELATRWAKSDQTEVGDRKLISYHNQWYVVEKFSDSAEGYQITDKINASDYDRIQSQIKGKERGSYERDIDAGISRYGNGYGRQGFDSASSQNGRANLQISQVVEGGDAGRASEGQNGRNNKNGGQDQPDVKFSKENSSAYWHYPEVTEQREKLDRAYRSARSQHKVDYVYRGLQSLDHNIGILLDETENETEKKILQTERRKVRQLIREISDVENGKIRFSKVDPRPGQSKVYSRQDAKDVVSAIVENHMQWKTQERIEVGKLSKADFAQAASKLFRDFSIFL